MSIEQKIEALTLAVETLTKVIAGTATPPVAKAEAPKAEAPKAEAPKAEAPKAEAPKAEAPAVNQTTYDDVKKAVLTASTAPGGRTKVIDLLARYGCAKATELRAEAWADFIKELEA